MPEGWNQLWPNGGTSSRPEQLSPRYHLHVHQSCCRRGDCCQGSEDTVLAFAPQAHAESYAEAIPEREGRRGGLGWWDTIAKRHTRRGCRQSELLAAQTTVADSAFIGYKY